MKWLLLGILLYSKIIVSHYMTFDTSFNNTGYATIAGFTTIGIPAVAMQPDNKIIIAGNSGRSEFIIGRFNSNGQLDTTFNANGTPGYTLSNYTTEGNWIYSLLVQVDGKIVAIGNGNNNGDSVMIIARYNIDGTPDTSFNTNGTPGYILTNLAGLTQTYLYAESSIDSNGNIIVGGQTTYANQICGFVARFLSNGTLDTTFNMNGIGTGGNPGYVLFAPVPSVSYFGKNLKLQVDGKIILAGTVNNTDWFITRYTNSGILDTTTFNTQVTPGYIIASYGSNVNLFGLAAAPNGNIFVAGVTTLSNVDQCFVASYTISGAINTNFNPTGLGSGVVGITTLLPELPNETATAAWGLGIFAEASNKIIINGITSANNVYNQYIARYNTNGSLDTTFTPTGYFINSNNTQSFEQFPTSIKSQNGKIATAGLNNANPAGFSFLLSNDLISSTSAEAVYGFNQAFISEFLWNNFYTQIITDATARTATKNLVNTIVSNYASAYSQQPNFNYINYINLISYQLSDAQVSLINSYPASANQINQYFLYLNKRIIRLQKP